MASVFVLLKSRVLPALLTAFGVVLVTAGLLSYVDPTTAGTAVIETPEIVEASEEPTPPPTPPPTPSASVEASASPSVEPTPKPTKTPTGREVATRVVVPALNIDLPVIRGTDAYPYCNVAMFLSSSKKASDDAFGQPGEGRVTYLYAHARDGMFGPIYNLAIQKKTPKKMIGMLIQVYTNYNRMYLYEVRQVRLHVTNLDAALARSKEEVWLQTSEGPKGTPGKTQVLTKFLSVEDSTQKESQPKAKPVRCG
jgi:sortase (surface protein transpeptidase)